MKIAVTQTKQKKVTIDVDFPAYVECSDTFDSGGWYNSQMQISSNGTMLCVTEHDGHWEFKREKTAFEKLDPSSTYYRRSTKAKFDELLRRALLNLSEFATVNP